MDKTSAHGSLLFFDNYMWMQAHLNDPRDPTTGSQLRAGQLKTNIGLCNATRIWKSALGPGALLDQNAAC